MTRAGMLELVNLNSRRHEHAAFVEQTSEFTAASTDLPPLS
jgi:hypothetical protein